MKNIKIKTELGFSLYFISSVISSFHKHFVQIFKLTLLIFILVKKKSFCYVRLSI